MVTLVASRTTVLINSGLTTFDIGAKNLSKNREYEKKVDLYSSFFSLNKKHRKARNWYNLQKLYTHKNGQFFDRTLEVL